MHAHTHTQCWWLAWDSYPSSTEQTSTSQSLQRGEGCGCWHHNNACSTVTHRPNNSCSVMGCTQHLLVHLLYVPARPDSWQGKRRMQPPPLTALLMCCSVCCFMSRGQPTSTLSLAQHCCVILLSHSNQRCVIFVASPITHRYLKELEAQQQAHETKTAAGGAGEGAGGATQPASDSVTSPPAKKRQ